MLVLLGWWLEVVEVAVVAVQGHSLHGSPLL